MSVPMPQGVKVGPYTYMVSQDALKLQAYERDKGAAYSGYSDHVNLLILVDATEAMMAQRETLWHEVKHCVHNLFKNSGNAVDDETHIRYMAPMELCVLRENPDLVTFLLDGD